MSRHNSKACVECIQKCLLQCQQREDSSSVVLRFFKILHNEEYSEILHLPPAFSEKVPHLVDQETYLEVSSGQRWTVTISKFDDSLAFHKGWNEFYMHQSLIVGQFLEFHYIKGSHFFVRVYERSGCEKINFNDGKNEAIIDQSVGVQDEPNQRSGTVPYFPGKKSRYDERNAGVQPSDTLDNANTRNKLSSSVGKVKEDSQPNTADESELHLVLVDVPIAYAENDNKKNSNLEDKTNDPTNMVSDIQKGEASNPIPGQEPTRETKNSRNKPAMDTKDAGNNLTVKKQRRNNFSDIGNKDNLGAVRNTEVAPENGPKKVSILDGNDDELVTKDAVNNAETGVERNLTSFLNSNQENIAKSS